MNGLVIAYSGRMAKTGRRGSATQEVQWLTDDELSSYLSLVRLMTWLPWSIDQQLQRDSQLRLVEYQTLAMLSNNADHTMRMSELAEITNASLSRLSHVVSRLEARGWVRREPCPGDGRFINAVLTDDGWAKVVATAPGHVAAVRRLLIDVLTPEQLRELGAISDEVLIGLAQSTIIPNGRVASPAPPD